MRKQILFMHPDRLFCDDIWHFFFFFWQQLTYFSKTMQHSIQQIIQNQGSIFAFSPHQFLKINWMATLSLSLSPRLSFPLFIPLALYKLSVFKLTLIWLQKDSPFHPPLYLSHLQNQPLTRLIHSQHEWQAKVTQ